MRSRFHLVMVLWAGGFACLWVCGCGGTLFPSSQPKAKGNIAIYKQQLEINLLRRYNNMPAWAGHVSKVELILPREPKVSVDGKQTRVEFDQLVYDQWGKRIPELEKEYFVVLFGLGGPQRVRTDPSISIGMHSGGGYSEADTVETGRVAALRNGMPRSEPPKSPSPQLSPPPPPPGVLEQDADGVPLVPPASEGLMPTRITRASASQEDKPAPVVREEEGLLRSMSAPASISGPLPRSEVRNLPERFGEPEVEPELDEIDF